MVTKLPELLVREGKDINNLQVFGARLSIGTLPGGRSNRLPPDWPLFSCPPQWPPMTQRIYHLSHHYSRWIALPMPVRAMERSGYRGNSGW